MPTTISPCPRRGAKLASGLALLIGWLLVPNSLGAAETDRKPIPDPPPQAARRLDALVRTQAEGDSDAYAFREDGSFRHPDSGLSRPRLERNTNSPIRGVPPRRSSANGDSGTRCPVPDLVRVPGNFQPVPSMFRTSASRMRWRSAGLCSALKRSVKQRLSPSIVGESIMPASQMLRPERGSRTRVAAGSRMAFASDTYCSSRRSSNLGRTRVESELTRAMPSAL